MGDCDFGLIGLAVMGQNLILNMNDHGFTVVAFNRTVAKVDSTRGTSARAQVGQVARSPLPATRTSSSKRVRQAEQ